RGTATRLRLLGGRRGGRGRRRRGRGSGNDLGADVGLLVEVEGHGDFLADLEGAQVDRLGEVIGGLVDGERVILGLEGLDGAGDGRVGGGQSDRADAQRGDEGERQSELAHKYLR